jgi:hypothetical protein
MRNELRAKKATSAVTATAFLWPRTPLMAPRRWIRLVASRASLLRQLIVLLCRGRYRPGPFQPSTSCQRPGAGGQLEFRILGPLQVWDQGGEVSLGGRKPRALLAVLLLHPNQALPC